MSDLPSDDHNGPRVRPGDSPAEGVPRWVKLFGVAGLVLTLLLVVKLLAGENHGPGRHIPSTSLTPQHVLFSGYSVQAAGG